jgi:hypothetical protein
MIITCGRRGGGRSAELAGESDEATDFEQGNQLDHDRDDGDDRDDQEGHIGERIAGT